MLILSEMFIKKLSNLAQLITCCMTPFTKEESCHIWWMKGYKSNRKKKKNPARWALFGVSFCLLVTKYIYSMKSPWNTPPPKKKSPGDSSVPVHMDIFRELQAREYRISTHHLPQFMLFVSSSNIIVFQIHCYTVFIQFCEPLLHMNWTYTGCFADSDL